MPVMEPLSLVPALADGQADFALCHRKARDGIHHEDDLVALIAEIFGDGCGRHGALDAHERGLVGRRDDDDGTLESFLAEVAFDEVAHLAATLADERDDADVGFRVAGDHGEQRRFADARARHDADALPVAHRDEAVDGAHADVEVLVDARALERRGRRRLQRVFLLREDWPLVIHRVAEAVEHAAEEFRPDFDFQRLLRRDDLAARPDALHFADRHEHDKSLPETDHFGRHGRDVGEMRTHVAELADADRRALRLNDEADDLRDFARELDGHGALDGIREFFDIDLHQAFTSSMAWRMSSIWVWRRASTPPFGVSMTQSPGTRLSSDVIVSSAPVPVRRLRNSSRARSTRS